MLKNYVVSTFAIVLRTNVNKQKKKNISGFEHCINDKID